MLYKLVFNEIRLVGMPGPRIDGTCAIPPYCDAGRKCSLLCNQSCDEFDKDCGCHEAMHAIDGYRFNAWADGHYGCTDSCKAVPFSSKRKCLNHPHDKDNIVPDSGECGHLGCCWDDNENDPVYRCYLPYNVETPIPFRDCPVPGVHGIKNRTTTCLKTSDLNLGWNHDALKQIATAHHGDSLICNGSAWCTWNNGTPQYIYTADDNTIYCGSAGKWDTTVRWAGMHAWTCIEPNMPPGP